MGLFKKIAATIGGLLIAALFVAMMVGVLYSIDKTVCIGNHGPLVRACN